MKLHRRLSVWILYLDSLTAFHPEGSATSTVLPLSYPYAFEVSSHIDLGLILTRDHSDSLQSHLSDWLLTNGYHFDNIQVNFFLEPDSIQPATLRITIDTLNLRLDKLWFHINSEKGANRDLSEQNPVLIDYVDIPDGELPPGSGSDVSDPGDLDFPAVLYETIREDGTRGWNFEKEFRERYCGADPRTTHSFEQRPGFPPAAAHRRHVR